MCKSCCELIIAIVVLIFSFLLWNWMYSRWVIVIAAIILLIHSFTCKKCFSGSKMAASASTSAKSAKKK